MINTGGMYMKRLLRLGALFCISAMICGCSAGKAVPDATTEETASRYPKADKLIALTFDDGPNVHMGTMLDALAQYDAKATFFVIGRKINSDSAVYIERAVQEGHEIGNHSFNHVKLTELSEQEILDEINKTQDAVYQITGIAPRWFRSPFGASNEQTTALIKMPRAGYGISVGDGSNSNSADERYLRLINGAYDGAIVLIHVNGISAEVLPQMLETLKMQGYEFVTVSELFARRNVEPGFGVYKEVKPVS